MKTFLFLLKNSLPLLALAGLLLVGTPAPLRADTCDDIGQLGDNWHAVADYIDKHSDDGKLRKAEAARVRADVHKYSPGTAAMAKVLIENFNAKNKDEARAKSLGKQLKANLDELAALGEGDTWDDVGDIVTKLGDILNKISEMCADGK